MITRRIENQIVEALHRIPAVVLTGPRQIGKTTLAIQVSKSIPSVYLDLEDPLDQSKVSDIKSFHEENRNRLIILDEIQKTPGIFSPIRSIIDLERRKGNKNGLFLFLGSASMELLRQSSQSLAGRISYQELYPIDLLEYRQIIPTDINTLWLRGGFPESLLAKTDKESLSWRKDFIRSYLERDIPQIGLKLPAATLSRFWTLLAHLQGTTLNVSQVARNLEVTSPTIHRYLDLMVDLLLVRRLQPWKTNEGKRLVKSPKIYVRDSGIAHALVNIADYNTLLSHPISGGSWEGFVIENICSVLPHHVRSYYYRSQAGAEIDLILEFSPTEKWAIEIKRSSTPDVRKGFYIAADDIQATRRYVVYSGLDKFSIGKGTTAIPVAELMNEVMGV